MALITFRCQQKRSHLVGEQCLTCSLERSDVRFNTLQVTPGSRSDGVGDEGTRGTVQAMPAGSAVGEAGDSPSVSAICRDLECGKS